MRDKNEVEKQTAAAALRASIAALPLVGGALNEFIFEVRGRIKQERINKFVQAFHAYLASLEPGDLHIDQIEKEDFGDFFEALLIRVSQNHSLLKRQAFQRLLTNQLRRPKDIDYSLLYLDIIGGMHEKQIGILHMFYTRRQDCSLHTEWQARLRASEQELHRLENYKNDAGSGIVNEDLLATGEQTHYLEEAIDKARADIQKAKMKIELYREPYRPHAYGIAAAEFGFLIQDLCNKGLLIDYSMQYGYDPLTLVEIADLGTDLVDFLAE